MLSKILATGHLSILFYSDDTNCYRLVHTGKLWEMFNEVARDHRTQSPCCEGNLDFDYAAEEKRGLCWRERVVCDSCSFTSQKYNLYNEIQTGRPGRKPATANVGLNVALTQLPIGPTSVRKMCLSSNIPAPSRRGMQTCSTKVCKAIEKVNIGDMKTRREGLKTINRLRGRPANEIAIQSDGVFNNPLYSGVGKTPFQPATQCSYSVVENITPKKQVIAIQNVNKLCSKHGFHSVDDDTCSILSGECSSTIPVEKNIGDEKEWAKSCFLDLKHDHLEVKYVTTDPDTGAYKAAEELRSAHITTTIPEHQMDTRHLAQNHRKTIKNKATVLAMMPGLTKSYRQTLQNRFSVDLSMRCQAEFESAHQYVNGDFEKLKAKIQTAYDAIIMCYGGDHTLCETHSNVCKGKTDNNWLIKSEFLPGTFRINVSNESHKKTLMECIDYRLAPNMLEKTKTNTNTQKVESVNRVIRRSLPRNVTYSRNFSGRAHSAIFASNNGPGESIIQLCSKVGCPIPSNSRVSAALLTEQKISEMQKKRAGSMKRKQKRQQRRKKLYKLYEKHHEEKNYKKGKLLVEAAQKRRILTKTNQCIRNEHTYAAKLIKRAIRVSQKKIQGGQCSSEQAPV